MALPRSLFQKMNQAYAVLTRARSEPLVAEDLAELGLVAFVPTVRRWVTRMGKRGQEESALLPRYLFVLSDDIERDFAAIRHMRRVNGILGNDGIPQPISARWVCGLMMSQAFSRFDYTQKRKPSIPIHKARAITVHGLRELAKAMKLRATQDAESLPPDEVLEAA